jgi:L-aminopeptidase/D-esterase-like protein
VHRPAGPLEGSRQSFDFKKDLKNSSVVVRWCGGGGTVVVVVVVVVAVKVVDLSLIRKVDGRIIKMPDQKGSANDNTHTTIFVVIISEHL